MVGGPEVGIVNGGGAGVGIVNGEGPRGRDSQW